MNEEMNKEDIEKLFKETDMISNKLEGYRLLREIHLLAENFLNKENPTMEEYNKIIVLFDSYMSAYPLDMMLYIEEISFIVDVNIKTPLITIESIDKIIRLYEGFVKRAMELSDTLEDRKKLQEIYDNINNERKDIEYRRNNYLTKKEDIIYEQCENCLRTIYKNNNFCNHCGNILNHN